MRILPILLLVAVLLSQWATAQPPATEPGGGIPPALESALAKARGGDDLAAISELEKLVEDPAAPAGAYELLGALYLAQGRAREAIAVLQPLADGGHPDPVVLFNTARALLELGRPEEAEKYLVLSVDRAPVSRATVVLAELRHAEGNYHDVVRLLKPMAEGRVGDGLERDEPGLSAKVSWLYGRALLESGQLERAVAPIQRVTRLTPSNKEAWESLGEILTELGRVEEAYEALSKAQSIAKEGRSQELQGAERAKKRLMEAYALRESGKFEEALAALREVEKLTPHNPLPWVLEVRLLIDMGRASEALEKAEYLVQITRGDSEALYLRGSARMALKDNTGAELDFRRVLETVPQHRAAMNSLALLLLMTDRSDEARELLTRILAKWPDDTIAASNLELLEQSGGADEP